MLSVPKKKNLPKSQFKAKQKGEKSESHYNQCVPLCVRYLCAGAHWERGMRRRLSRGLMARTARDSLYVCFAPERPSSPKRDLS